MANDFEIYPDADSLAKSAAEHFVRIASSAISQSEIFRVALSGGSTPLRMYSFLLNASFADRVEWERVFFFWGDERFLPHDDPESNYRNAHQNLLRYLPISEEQIHPIRTDHTPEQNALEYAKTLELQFNISEPQVSMPRFDLILLGMGDDGHTASLFPNTNALADRGEWVVANYIETLNKWRITMTPLLINAAEHVVFLVEGGNKADRLNEVINGPYQPANLPAQLIKPENGRLLWLIDEAAAAQLSSK